MNGRICCYKDTLYHANELFKTAIYRPIHGVCPDANVNCAKYYPAAFMHGKQRVTTVELDSKSQLM